MNDVLDSLIDKKVKSILDVFIKNKGQLFHIKKVSKISNVPIATSFRLIKKLSSLGFITIIKINKFKVYKLADNKKTELLTGLWKNG